MTFKHAISWFEIPTRDIERAQRFYEAIFNMQMMVMDLQNIQMRLFPLDDPMNVGGALTYNENFYHPSSTEGPLIYLNGNPDVQNIIDKVEEAGGKVLVPKTLISPDHGFMAVFLDTEGNRIGLHSIPV